MKNAIIASTLAAACIGLSMPALAVVVAHDNFESYSTGMLAGNNGGSGFTGAYSTNAATDAAKGRISVETLGTPLSYSGGTISMTGGSKAVAVGALDSTNAINRQIASLNADTIYVSFLFRFSNPSGVVSETFLQFGLGTGANTEPKASFGVQGNDLSTNPPGGVEQFFARAGSSTTNTTVSTETSPIISDQTYLLVAKISKAAPGASNYYNRVTLYVNPTSLTEPGSSSITASGTTNTTTMATNFTYFDLRTARRNDSANEDEIYYIDNLTIGTTFTDVVSVPEPASIGMLAAGAMLLTARKRRLTRG